MKFCPNCGQPIEAETNFCRNCGYNLGTNPNPTPVNQVNYVQQGTAQPNYAKPKTGKGLSVASLVLGIISVIWSLLSVVSLSEVEDKLLEAYEETELSAMATKISFGIGFVLIMVVTGILALIFGLKSKKTGMGKAGIILSGISLLIAVISFIYILSISL